MIQGLNFEVYKCINQTSYYNFKIKDELIYPVINRRKNYGLII